MTAASITVETAPRDLAELSKLGRYNQRLLAEQLGMISTADEKAAFLSLSQDKMAEELLSKLQEKDGGGKKPAKAAVSRTPVTGKAAATTKAPATRTPNPPAEPNDAATNDAATNAAAVLDMLEEINTNQTTLLDALESLRTEIRTVQTATAGSNRLTMLSISLGMFLAEEVMKAPGAQVLASAYEQLSEIEPLVKELIGEELGGEDNEEGNG